MRKKMCNNLCERFEKIYYGESFYCQDCAKFIYKKYLKKEKGIGRMRCQCCNGLVRNKPRRPKPKTAFEIKRSL